MVRTGPRWPVFGALALGLVPAAVVCVQLGAMFGKLLIESPGNLSITSQVPGLVRASSRVLLACVVQGLVAGSLSLVLRERPRWPGLIAVSTFGLLMLAAVIILWMR